jgi:hypothetical protein
MFYHETLNCLLPLLFDHAQFHSVVYLALVALGSWYCQACKRHHIKLFALDVSYTQHQHTDPPHAHLIQVPEGGPEFPAQPKLHSLHKIIK